MSIRSYSNANTARVQAFVADGGLAAIPTIDTTQRVVVIGMFKNDSLVPVQSLFPAIAGSISIKDMLSSTYNKATDGSLYPSEVSLALEELQRAGVEFCQVIRSASDDRYRDVTARMARQRYIANENAYELLVDTPVDYIYAVNVVAGLKGDGMYNANMLGTTTVANDTSVEVIYDTELYASETVAANKLIADLPGFVAGAAADYAKSAVAADEDLVYQLADACQVISQNGTYCIGVIRTMNAVELKSITTLNMHQVGGLGTTFGADATGTALVSGLVPNAAKWAMVKTGMNGATELNLTGDYDFTTSTGADKALGNKAALEAYEAIARLGDAATGTKDVVKLSAEPVYNDGTALGSTAVPYSDVLIWRLAFGTPSRSEMRKWEAYMRDFGNSYASGAVSMADLNGVDDADGNGVADDYKMFATTTHEKPLDGELDTTVVKDFNGSPVDLGVFIDCVAANSIMPLGSNTRLISSVAPKKFTFGAGVGQIVGWYATTGSNVSTTRSATANLEALGFLGGRAVSDLTRRRFQVFFVEDALYRLARGITMGKFVTDVIRTNFINRFTTRVVKDALDLSSAEGRKYLGKPDSAEVRAAIKQRLEQEFTRWAKPEDGRLKRPAQVEVLSVGTDAVIGRLLIQLKLAIPGEILEVTTQATLER